MTWQTSLPKRLHSGVPRIWLKNNLIQRSLKFKEGKTAEQNPTLAVENGETGDAAKGMGVVRENAETAWSWHHWIGQAFRPQSSCSIEPLRLLALLGHGDSGSMALPASEPQGYLYQGWGSGWYYPGAPSETCYYWLASIMNLLVPRVGRCADEWSSWVLPLYSLHSHMTTLILANSRIFETNLSNGSVFMELKKSETLNQTNESL